MPRYPAGLDGQPHQVFHGSLGSADGEVTEINTELEDDPSLVNAEPYAAGWMFRVRVALDGSGDAALPTDLLSAAEYEELTRSAG